MQHTLNYKSPSNSRIKIGILGGGLTGLTVAANLDCDFEVLEKENRCGGLCRSFKQSGFTFDCTGAHIIFSRNPRPVDYMLSLLADNVHKGRRNNKIYYKDRYVKYPFENGLSELPKQDTFECLYHYLNNDYPRPANFKDWMYYTFGKGITEKYLLPYNRKIWNYDPAQMSMHWVDGRVPKPPAEDVIKSAIGIETEGYTHQLYFYYPRSGGIQAVIESLEQKVGPRISVDFEVHQITKEADGWVVSNGRTAKKFDRIVSAIPVFDLIAALSDVPVSVAEAVSALKYNSLISVMLGLKTGNTPDYTAVYFPDSDAVFHRIAFPKNFSPENVPGGMSSVVAEITSNPGDGVWEMKDENVIDLVAGQLQSLGIISKNDICCQNLTRAKYAYVVYDQDYQKNIEVVRRYLADTGIMLCGRFAEFEYLNMDACVEHARQLAVKLNKTHSLIPVNNER